MLTIRRTREETQDKCRSDLQSSTEIYRPHLYRDARATETYADGQVTNAMGNFHYYTSYEVMNILYRKRSSINLGDIHYHPLKAGVMPRSLVWGMMPLGWIYLGSVWYYGNYYKAVAKTLDNWLFPLSNGYMLFLDLPRDLNQQTINLRFRGTALPNSGVIYSASPTTREELDAHIMYIQELVLHSPDEVKGMLALSGVRPSIRSELGRFEERDRQALKLAGLE